MKIADEALEKTPMGRANGWTWKENWPELVESCKRSTRECVVVKRNVPGCHQVSVSFQLYLANLWGVNVCREFILLKINLLAFEALSTAQRNADSLPIASLAGGRDEEQTRLAEGCFDKRYKSQWGRR